MSGVSAIQMVSSDKLDENLRRAAALLQRAAEAGSQIAVLPENFAYLGPETRLIDLAEADGEGPIQSFLARQSAELDLWIVGGTLPVSDLASGKVSSACPIYNNHGERVARYDKIHLFDVDLTDYDGQHYRESDFIEPGKQLTVVNSPLGRLGIAICYDLRFPELFKAMADADADLVALPAAFTAATGAAHWDVLTRCRAVDNQLYIVAANQGGQHSPERETWGHSRVVDAWGKVVAEHSAGEGLASAEIDADTLRQIRRQLPVRKHHRL